MSSAPARNLPSLGRALRGIAWTALFAVMAAGAAGLIAEASHTPGSPSRADLTAEGDMALSSRLDAATSRLTAISANVDGLADAAKTALEEITSADPTKLQQSLEHGGELTASITTDTRALQVALAGLPGDEPDAMLRYSNDTLVRRAATLAALAAAAGLEASWQQVSARALEASGVTTLIAQHDQIVLDAAAQGRTRQYAKAAATLDQAIQTVVAVKEQRTRLIADTGQTVLDAWIERNRDYDLALQGVYVALVASKGDPTTVRVQRARAAERAAFNQLPPDRRTIIVIIGEVARGGLTQAVIAIEDARGRIEDALAEAGLQPGPAGAPSPTEPAGSSGAPGESSAPGASTVPLP
ncbi:MAG TPA: collagen-like protein [Patescibacteria group bacterium]|nr:collagen-like protein [Patescibacteria group bacterium]